MRLNGLVSIPNTGWIHKHISFVRSKLEKDERYNLKIIEPTHSPYVNNLHKILNDFKEGMYDFWLSMDSDNPPKNNPLDLVELDKDIIGCPTPVWHNDLKTRKAGERPIYWNVYDYVPEKDAYKEHENKKGLQKVDAIGTGCFLVSKRVFHNEFMQMAPFMRQWNADGTVNKGNDISFCERARANGFEIYAHFDYSCRHFVELELTEVIEAFMNQYEPGKLNG